MRRLSFAQRFLLGSLVILLVGMVGIGFWVSNQISDGVIHRTAATNALYVDSLVAPRAQDLATSESLSSDSIDKLDWLLTGTPLGNRSLSFGSGINRGESSIAPITRRSASNSRSRLIGKARSTARWSPK